ncbi:recombinase family protein [Streptomyces subrutilus]|uniref:recombinase family protein n=1 Tax=Streptomyces subrutilus TaxID=36818 RepID=UPI002E118356|nr:recombinase family protein [Streptomyces subrutilus]
MQRKRNRGSLYVRLSMKAGETNASLEGMISELRELCAKEGLEEVALHVDDGLSGGFRDRPEFQAWIADARQERADVLVTPHVDRLTREGLNVAATLLDVVEGKDSLTGRVVHAPVRLMDARGIDSTHGDAFRFRFVLQAEVARSERERMRDRTRSSVRRLRRKGRWPGGTPPFGYQAVDNPDGPGKSLAVEPTEAKAIQEAANRVLAGDPLTLVCRALNHQGVKPRRAREWSRVTLAKVLCGDAALGRVTINGELLRDEDGEIMAPYGAILTPEQSVAIRAALKPDPTRPKASGRHPARILSGLLFCVGCPNPLTVARRKAGVVYRCQTRSQGGMCEQPVSVSAPMIEDHVTGLYLKAVGWLPYFREEVRVSNAAELSLIESDIADTLRELASSATAEGFTRLQRLQERRNRLTAETPERLVTLVDSGRTCEEVFRGALVDDQRAMLDAAFVEIVIGPGRRGPKLLDPERVHMLWTPDDPADQVD